MADSLNKTISALRSLQHGIVCLGRLHALAVLTNGTLALKSKFAEASHTSFRYAAAINDFLHEYYRTSAISVVAWTQAYHPIDSEVLKDGSVVVTKLEEKISELSADISATAQYVKELVSNQPLLTPVLHALSTVFSHFSGYPVPGTIILLDIKATNEVVRVLRGPSAVPLDDSFTPTYSLLQQAVPGFGESVTQVVPYFWGLAIRESLAADLCALSIVEYDGMPLKFYLDMSKQSWDEMRHSQFFFDKAVELLPELLEELEEDDPLLANVHQFMSSGKGLPIPKERNLYEAILNASLIERLILLHRDTETPGIIRIQEKISSPFSIQRPWLADALTVVMRDEVTHAGFGNTWLEYLIPNQMEREDVILNTELLRGVYLLTSFAHHGNKDLIGLLQKYSSGHVAPTSEIVKQHGTIRQMTGHNNSLEPAILNSKFDKVQK